MDRQIHTDGWTDRQTDRQIDKIFNLLEEKETAPGIGHLANYLELGKSCILKENL